MSIEFTMEQEFARSPEHVFAALTNPEGARDWMPGFVRIERLTDGAFDVGTEWRETRRMFGRECTEQFEVTTCEPPHRFGLRIDGSKGASKSGEYLFDYTVRPRSDVAVVSIHGEIRGLGLISGFFARVMMGSLKKCCAKDMQALAEHLGSA